MSSPDLGADGAILFEAMAFVWRESEHLDARRHDDWLALWAPEGHYVIPIDPKAEDFSDTLNYAYDDAEMRRLRVARLGSRHSMSAVSAARTVRTVSRFVLAEADHERFVVRCAQLLVESKNQVERTYAADLTYTLVRTAEGLRLAQKVVRLVNSTDALGGVAYLF